jgi:signal transduction histidine kinase/ActR/RegA family two-component response regulator
MMWDVSLCRAAQDKHQREKTFYTGLIQGSSTATFVLDREHRVLIWNRACEEMTGITGDQVLGTNSHWRGFYDAKQPCLADMVVDGEMKTLSSLFEEHAQSAVVSDGWEAAGWFRNRRGENMYLTCAAAPIRGSDGSVIAVIQTMEDVTAHKREEEASREKDRQILQLQKMEAVGRLAGGIAHGFNNILAIIMGYGGAIKQTVGEQHPVSGDLNEIIRASERGARLTKQLLALGRTQMISTRPLNLNATLVDMQRVLGSTLGEHIEIVFRPEPRLWMIMGDLGLVEQLILNLALNARDAMPDGGKLTLQTANVRAEDPARRADIGLSEGRYAILTIRDSGCGMDEETRKHLFEPFFTTKREQNRAGLGLATAYGIVQQLHGRIDVVTQPGLGASFMIYLPALEEHVAVEEEAPGLEPATPARGETILVAEDEESLRKLLVRNLKNMGYTVLEACDGVQAMHILSQYEESIDLVLTDVVMPRMGGKELARQVREIRPNVKVLFSSGFTDGSLVQHGLMDGTEDIIIKPFTRDDVARRIRQILDDPEHGKAQGSSNSRGGGCS